MTRPRKATASSATAREIEQNADATFTAFPSAGRMSGASKVPSPWFRKICASDRFFTARSGQPSASKSPVVKANGSEPPQHEHRGRHDPRDHAGAEARLDRVDRGEHGCAL